MRAVGNVPVLVIVGLATAALAGCTAGTSASECAAPTALTTPVLPAPSGLAYAGPAGSAEFRPWTTLVADLPLPVGGDDHLGPLVPTPDGGLSALLQSGDPDDELGSQLLELRPTGGGSAVVDEVDVPVNMPRDVHALPDGRIVVVGALSSDGGLLDVPDLGIAVLDPATGRFETTVVVPSEPGAVADETSSSSALSPDGRVLYLAVSLVNDRDGTSGRELVAVDARNGEVLARRDLSADVAGLVSLPERASLDELSAGPSGVATVFQSEVGGCESGYGAAVLQRYTPALEPDGPPVELAGPSPDTYTDGLFHTDDGSLLVVRTSYHGDLTLLALHAEGTRATQLGRWEAQAVARVDDGRTAVLLDLDGVRSVDLTGEVNDVVVPIPCLEGTPLEPDSDEAWTGIIDLVTTGDQALVLGVCDAENPRARLWVLER